MAGLSSDVIGGGVGVEGHVLLVGGGWDTHYCCDGKRNLWRVRTRKVCFGPALGAFGGVTGMIAKRSSCPDIFSGVSAEFAAGYGEVGLTPAKDDVGIRAGAGGGLGAKATVCYYFVKEKEIVSCCKE